MGDRRFAVLILFFAGVLAFSSSGFAQNGWIWFNQGPGRQKQQDQQNQQNQKPPAPAPRHNISGM